MLNTPSAIFFDLDGTLLDTAPEFTYCINRLLTELYLPPITIATLRASVSKGATGMLECAFGDNLKHFSADQLKKRFLGFYQEQIGSKTEFFTGIPALLEELEKTKTPWGIVTNKSSQFTLPLIGQFPLLSQAQCVVSGDTLKVNKPHPDPLFLAANQLGIAPGYCWYVGDARTDVEASRAAGMKSIVANYGYIPTEEDPNTWQADHYINHPRQVFDYLNKR